jgi:hypothetical protein
MADQENENETVIFGDRYQEEGTTLPNPTDQFGTYDTTGGQSSMDDVSPIFEIATKQSQLAAKEALESDNPRKAAAEANVILPEQNIVTKTGDDIDTVKARFQDDVEPVDLSKGSPAQRQAAESGDEAAEKVESQRAEQGAGGAADPQAVPRSGSDSDSGQSDSSGGSSPTSTGQAGSQSEGGKVTPVSPSKSGQASQAGPKAGPSKK